MAAARLRERGNFDGMELHMTEPQHVRQHLLFVQLVVNRTSR